MRYSKLIYSLPFKKSTKIKICDAPYHKTSKSMENCIDFYMPEGTPILSAKEGIALEVVDQYHKSYKKPGFAAKSNLICINHKNNERSIYVHLKHDSARIKEGDLVKTGQVIASSGKTGYATYPHLHFGVYSNKENLKPRLKGLNSITFKNHKAFE
ncbi:MAG: M23 family metallopeptidase [archaeon]